MTAAQRCIKICGPQTRQQLRAVAKPAAKWGLYLTRQFLGPKRAHFLDRQARYYGEDVDQAAWEQAAREAGLEVIQIDYADDGPISAGVQLYMLATTLYKLGIYEALGDPAETGLTASQIKAWTEQIIS